MRFESKFVHLLVFVALSLSSGCAIGLNMPTVRFDSPEARGKPGSGSIGIGAATSHYLEIIPDTTANPPVDRRSFQRSFNFPARVEFGILARLDIELRAPMATFGTAPAILKLKYQVIGEPRSTAKMGNFALAVSAGGALTSNETTHYGGSINAVTDASFNGFDLAGLAGYRVSDPILLYGGVFYTRYNFDGTITQTGSGAIAAPYTFAGHAEQSGLNFGASAGGGGFNIRAEMAAAFAFSGGARIQSLQGGLMLGFEW